VKKQWIIVAAVLALLTFGAVLGLKLTPDLFPVEVGSRAPQFRAIDLGTGDSVTLDRYRGQVVLLNIWRRGASRAASRCFNSASLSGARPERAESGCCQY